MSRRDSIGCSLYSERNIAKLSDSHAMQYHIPSGIIFRSRSDLEDDAGL